MAIVSVQRCGAYDEAEAAVHTALGDVAARKHLKKGMNVLVKPNILASVTPDKGVTTHPAVVDAICSYCKPLGVKVFIGESSGSAAARGTANAFERSGLAAVAKRWGVEFINFDDDEHIVVKPQGATRMKNVKIAKRLQDMDCIIDACKMKTHMLTGFTGAVKNMFGILPGRAKVNAHTQGKDLRTFSHIMIDIFLAGVPRICVMDAIVGMEGNGPSSGTLKQTGLVLASDDAFAMDIVASRIMGFSRKELVYLRLAQRRGLLPDVISVVGEKDVSVPYKKPLSYRLGLGGLSNIVFQFLQVRFDVDTDKCKRCAYCVRACPEQAITMDEFPDFKKERCILCYCCHELCPYDAIILKKPLLARIADRLIGRFKDD